MNLETIIQSKVNQREKNKYDILTHVYGIQKDGTDEPIGRAAMEMQTQVTDLLHRGGEGESVGWMERVSWKHIHYHM